MVPYPVRKRQRPRQYQSHIGSLTTRESLEAYAPDVVDCAAVVRLCLDYQVIKQPRHHLLLCLLDLIGRHRVPVLPVLDGVLHIDRYLMAVRPDTERPPATAQTPTSAASFTPSSSAGTSLLPPTMTPLTERRESNARANARTARIRGILENTDLSSKHLLCFISILERYEGDEALQQAQAGEEIQVGDGVAENQRYLCLYGDDEHHFECIRRIQAAVGVVLGVAAAVTDFPTEVSKRGFGERRASPAEMNCPNIKYARGKRGDALSLPVPRTSEC